MRKAFDFQQKLGGVDIENIQFDVNSRDEIPKALIGLQAIFCDTDARNKIFEILMEMIPSNVDKNNGRRGMDLWKILVLGVIRLSRGWDFDKLKEIADNHKTLRLMLNLEPDDETKFPLQTIKDNLAFFEKEQLDRISQIAVSLGHKALGVENEDLQGACDSFVVETNVHYPTDINLLWDALRVTIRLIARLCDGLGVPGWRKFEYNIKNAKKLFQKANKSRKKGGARDQAIIEAHLAYLSFAELIVEKVKETIFTIGDRDFLTRLAIGEIENYIAHAERQIDQIRRRVINGETIPHHEKVFSIFEEHTELIIKGKAGVPCEFGLGVCVVKDQFGFVLHHLVMKGVTDDKVAVPMIEETVSRFPNFVGCSFDKGFYTPGNAKKLGEVLENVTLPKKGKLSEEDKEREENPEFKERRRNHSAVESTINALENHGLDVCPDRGLHGFERYVGLAVVARNIQILGHILQQKEKKRRDKSKRKAA